MLSTSKNDIIPQVSICIPYYKQPALLKRNLESIFIQDFKDYEVIITDDSPEPLSLDIIETFSSKLHLRYYKNEISLGSPKNWNHAINLSKGEFIIVFHQDDYFTKRTSLSQMVETIQNHQVDFVFGKLYPDEKKYILKKIPYWITRLYVKPEIILTNNIIGPPSNVLFRASKDLNFDEKLIWVVDFELYFRWITQGKKYKFIEELIVEIGKHDQQITRYCDDNPLLKLNETIYLYNKHSNKIRLNIRLYDYYWRSIRNNRIKNKKMIFTSPHTYIPIFMQKQIQIQNLIGFRILKNGLISKIIMFLSWLIFQNIFSSKPNANE